MQAGRLRSRDGAAASETTAFLIVKGNHSCAESLDISDFATPARCCCTVWEGSSIAATTRLALQLTMDSACNCGAVLAKLMNLAAQLREHPVNGRCGIGHTRWATHGGVTEENAHPHRDASGEIVVIQNGIVENYLELKERLIAHGHQFASQTDTEVIARLLGEYYEETGSLEQAMRRTLAELRGGNAIVAMTRREPGRIVAARLGHAGGIVIGAGDDEMFVASDVPAILDYTRRVVFLDDREIAVIDASGATISRLDGTPIARDPITIPWDPVSAAKGDYKHFMQRRFSSSHARSPMYCADGSISTMRRAAR